MATMNERIKQLREDRHITQKVLAEFLGTSTSHVGMMEIGKRLPSIEMLEAPADYFNVSTDYIIGKSNISMRFLNENELLLIDEYRMADDRTKKMVCDILDYSKSMQPLER